MKLINLLRGLTHAPAFSPSFATPQRLTTTTVLKEEEQSRKIALVERKPTRNRKKPLLFYGESLLSRPDFQGKKL